MTADQQLPTTTTTGDAGQGAVSRDSASVPPKPRQWTSSAIETFLTLYRNSLILQLQQQAYLQMDQNQERHDLVPIVTRNQWTALCDQLRSQYPHLSSFSNNEFATKLIHWLNGFRQFYQVYHQDPSAVDPEVKRSAAEFREQYATFIELLAQICKLGKQFMCLASGWEAMKAEHVERFDEQVAAQEDTPLTKGLTVVSSDTEDNEGVHEVKFKKATVISSDDEEDEEEDEPPAQSHPESVVDQESVSDESEHRPKMDDPEQSQRDKERLGSRKRSINRHVFQWGMEHSQLLAEAYLSIIRSGNFGERISQGAWTGAMSSILHHFPGWTVDRLRDSGRARISVFKNHYRQYLNMVESGSELAEDFVRQNPYMETMIEAFEERDRILAERERGEHDAAQENDQDISNDQEDEEDSNTTANDTRLHPEFLEAFLTLILREYRNLGSDEKEVSRKCLFPSETWHKIADELKERVPDTCDSSPLYHRFYRFRAMYEKYRKNQLAATSKHPWLIPVANLFFSVFNELYGVANDHDAKKKEVDRGSDKINESSNLKIKIRRNVYESQSNANVPCGYKEIANVLVDHYESLVQDRKFTPNGTIVSGGWSSAVDMLKKRFPGQSWDKKYFHRQLDTLRHEYETYCKFVTDEERESYVRDRDYLERYVKARSSRDALLADMRHGESRQKVTRNTRQHQQIENKSAADVNVPPCPPKAVKQSSASQKHESHATQSTNESSWEPSQHYERSNALARLLQKSAFQKRSTVSLVTCQEDVETSWCEKRARLDSDDSPRPPRSNTTDANIINTLVNITETFRDTLAQLCGPSISDTSALKSCLQYVKSLNLPPTEYVKAVQIVQQKSDVFLHLDHDERIRFLIGSGVSVETPC